MAEISKITLPSGNTYDIKDAVARQAIAGGISYIVAWNGASTPVVANIPAGVTVTYNGTNYTGTLAASSAQAGAFYLVSSSNTANNKYSEYVAADIGGTKTWEKLGDMEIDLSNLGDLAYKDNVTLSKGSGDNALGEATTFTNASSAVTFSGGSTDTFVKSYPGSINHMMLDTASYVINTGNASTWAFNMGTGADSETLIISGSNSTKPSVSDVTVATGSLGPSGAGAAVMTGLGTATTASAVTGIGTGTAAAQTITVGTNDKVKVAKYDDLSVSAS